MVGRRAEALFGLGATALGVSTAALEGAHPVGYFTATVVGLALAAGRRRPRLASLSAAVALLAGAPFGPLPVGVLLATSAHAFCAGRWDEPRWGLAGLIALLAATELNVLLATDSPVPALLLLGAGYAGGRALREREVVAAQLAERVRELEEERDAHAALSVRYERARIASELHDIVAHAISMMVVQASAGQRLVHRDPDAIAETFEAIAGAARQAEQDMGRLVALLGDEEPIGPAPDLALIQELVARAAGSGLAITLRLEGEREGLPAALVAIAYRVGQEGIPNALRYAPGAPVHVEVRGDQESLAVEVTNGPARGEVTLAGAGMGSGLRGLRERLGGVGLLEAEPTPDGGWRLSARLPRQLTARGC